MLFHGTDAAETDVALLRWDREGRRSREGREEDALAEVSLETFHGTDVAETDVALL